MAAVIIPHLGWSSKSKAETQDAIKECLQLSTDCSKGSRGRIGSWDVSDVTDMSQLFNHDEVPGANKFIGDISKWDVCRVTNMQDMFYSASSFNGDLSKWDVSRVTNMIGMFAHASSFNGDISKWDVSGVTAMNIMFHGASSFAQTLCGAWLTSTADKDGIFDGSFGQICSTNSNSETPSMITLN